MTRFVVRTVTGHRTPSGNSNGKQGMSAHVCDTTYIYAVAASYGSEDHTDDRGSGRQRLGVQGALAAAEAHARRLNLEAVA